jgi:molybdopterin biosynthesis enzyme MoaB
MHETCDTKFEPMDESRHAELDAMDETRDAELGRQLEAFGEPEHGPAYWRDVRQAVAKTRRPSFGGRLRASFAPRRVRLALAAAAVAVVAAATLLVGLPGSEGPQSVSAAEVLRNALAARSSLQTWQADGFIEWFDAGLWKEYHAYATRRFHVVQAAGGSGYETYDLVMVAGHRLADRQIEVYDATTGIAIGYDGSERTWGAEKNGPLGSPDAGGIPLIDAPTAIRVLAASGALHLDETVVAGRAAWTVTCPEDELAGLPPSGEDRPVYTVTVDKETWQPLAVQEVRDGRVTFRVRYSNVRVNEPLADDAFTLELPPGVHVKPEDKGFHRFTLDEAATRPGVTPLVPDFVPSGYERSDVAVADSSVIERAIENIDVSFTTRYVFALAYRRGFDWLTVTTRIVRDPDYTWDIDLCEEYDQDWSSRARVEVPIASGAFAGTTARILEVSVTSVPHLWAVKDGVLLTIAGIATADELLEVAESLEVYPGPSPAAE